jgi:HK97 family phage major capsid protein
MNVKEKELRGQLETTLRGARDIAAIAEKEDRDFSSEEREKVKGALEEAKKLKDQLRPYEEKAEVNAALADFGPATGQVEPGGNGSASQPIVAKAQESLGKQFVEAPEFKAWLKHVAPTGVIPESMKGVQSPPLHFGGLKALITGVSDTSAGALVQNDFRGLLDQGAFMRPLTIRDIVTTVPTTSDTIEYVRQGTPTNAAAPTAEATATTGTSGTKPESTIPLAKVTDTVKTIPHWIPATKRALSDAPQIRGLIDEFLRYGLEEELEDQIISGDGTGENFTGLVIVSGVQTHAKGTDSNVVAARKARTKVQTVGRARPNAYVMNPTDWEIIDLTTDNEQRYYFGGPMALGTPRLWGLPVVESEAVPAGTAYVGDFRKLVLYDREQATISVSDSHADFFIRNMVAILAELRAGFGVLRPSAIVKITGIAA